MALGAALVVVFLTGVGVAAATLLCLVLPMAAMVGWEIRRMKGSILAAPVARPGSTARGFVAVRLLGLWGVWALIGAVYSLIAAHADLRAGWYLSSLVLLVPLLVPGSVAYLLWADRHLPASEDGLDEFGRLLLGRWTGRDWTLIRDFLRGWAIKAFFLLYMASVLPDAVHAVVGVGPSVSGVVALASWLIALLFLMDAVFGTAGYILTFRALGSHIRSTNPYWLGWIAALLCYPPLILIFSDGLFAYKDGLVWTGLVGVRGALTVVWAAGLVVSAGIYAWSTVAFGIRFSNLTNRGIVTSGPYRYLKHPAYLSKNVFWWLYHVPVVSVLGPGHALRNTLLLMGVNLLYLLRARTEEWHLMADPAYRRYSAWMRRRHRAVVRRLLPGFETWRGTLRTRHTGGAGLRRLRRTGAVVAVLVLSVSSLAVKGNRFENPGAIVADFMDRFALPGAVVAHVGPSDSASAFALGMAAAGEPMTVGHHFDLASLSKPITAAAVLSLERAGAVDLDAAISDVVPWAAERDSRLSRTSLRNLLRHSGPWRDTGVGAFEARPTGTGCRAIAAASLARGTEHEPGVSYHYSNLGYCWLEVVLEEVTGRSYESVARERVLGPRGVDELHLGALPVPDPAVFHHLRFGGDGVRAGRRPLLGALGGAGGWTGTAPAYLEFASRPVDPLVYERPPYSEHDSPSFYGLGWRVWPQSGRAPLLTHFGSLPGAFTFVARSETATVVLLANGSPPDPEAAAAFLIDRLVPAVEARVRAERLVGPPSQE